MTAFIAQPIRNKLLIMLAVAVWLGMGVFTMQRAFLANYLYALLSPSQQTVKPGDAVSATYTLSPTGFYNGDEIRISWACPAGTTCTVDGKTASFITSLRYDKGDYYPTSFPVSVVTSGTTPDGAQVVVDALTPIPEGQHYVSTLTLWMQDFTVSAAPVNATVRQGGSVDDTVTVGGLHDFAGIVDLSVTGLPAGAVASWPQGASGTLSSGTTSFVKTLTLVPQAGAAIGTPYPFIIKAISGSFTHTFEASYTVTGSQTYEISLPNGGVAPVYTGQAAGDYVLRVNSKTGFTGGTVSLDLGWTGTAPSGTAVNWEGGTNTVTFPANPPENTYRDKKFTIATTAYDPQARTGTAGATYPFQITGTHNPDPPLVFASGATTLVVGDWSVTVDPSSVSAHYDCAELNCAPSLQFAIQKMPPEFPWTPNFRPTFSGMPESIRVITGSKNMEYRIFTYNAQDGTYTMTASNFDDVSQLTRTVQFDVVITGAPPPPTPDFRIDSITPSSVRVDPDATTERITTQATALNGFTGNVQFSTEWLAATPSGVSITWKDGDALTFAEGGATTQTKSFVFTTSAVTPVGTYPYRIAATSGEITRYLPADENDPNPPELVVGGMGVNSITLTATEEGDIARTVEQGQEAVYAITLAAGSGYAKNDVDLTVTNCPTASRCSFYNGSTEITSYLLSPGEVKPLIFKVITSQSGTTPPQSYAFSLTAKDRTNSAISATLALQLTVTAGPDFSLSVAPATLVMNEGEARDYTITVNGTGGFASDVNVAWTHNAPNVSFTPASSLTVSSAELGSPKAIQVRADPGSAGGPYTVTFSATSGSITKTMAAQLTINVAVDCSGCEGNTNGQTCTEDGCRANDDTDATCNPSSCYEPDGSFKNPAPANCRVSLARCQNFSVLKVRKDRQCEQWLDCQSSVAFTDPITGQTENKCSALGVCIQLGPDGTCAQFLDETGKANRIYETPQMVAGVTSKIRWFSGYSTGFHIAQDENGKNAVVAPYPVTDIAEVGLNGAGAADPVQNGTMEELRCLGGPRDHKSCIVPSDCRVGGGRCAEKQEPDVPGAISQTTCTTDAECTGAQAAGGTVTKWCRYISSWGADITCRNPQDSSWLGITAYHSDTNVEEAGFGYDATGTNHVPAVQRGERYTSGGESMVRWRIWEDAPNNFIDQSARTGGLSDPRYPAYAPEKHERDENNVLKVALTNKAGEGTGVGVPAPALVPDGDGYMLSFKYRLDENTSQPVPIKARLHLNFLKRASTTDSDDIAQGYNADGSDASIIELGTIGDRNVCSLDAKQSCSTDLDCASVGGGVCRDTTQWQTYVFGPVKIDASKLQTSKTPFVTFVTAKAPAAPHTFYLDDVSLKPALNYADADRASNEGAFAKRTVERGCRLYPRDNAPECEYTDDNGALYRGWRGYCLDKDPKDPNLCLTWWPLDVLTGENVLGAEPLKGYAGQAPLYQCLEQEGGGDSYLDFYVSDNITDADEKRWSVDPRAGMTEGKIGNTIFATGFPKTNIRLRDIDRIDVLFDAGDDGTDDNDNGNNENSWYNVECGSVLGAPNSASFCDTGHKSHYYFTVDANQFNRARSDDNGYRLYLMKHEASKDKVQSGYKFADEQPWNDVYDDSCNDSKFNTDNDQYMAMLFRFSSNDPNDSNNVLESIATKMCDDEKNNSINGLQWWRVIVRTKQFCNYIVKTVNTTNGQAEESVWQSRVQPQSSYIIPKLDIAYQSDTSPYGALTPPTPDADPSEWPNTYPTNGNIASSGAPLAVTAGGTELPRAGTAYAYDAFAAQKNYCFAPAVPNKPQEDPVTGGGPNVNVQTSNTCLSKRNIDACQALTDENGQGAPGTCVGRPGKYCSNNPLWACSTDADCLSAEGKNVGNGSCTGGSSDAGFGAGIRAYSSDPAKRALSYLQRVFAKGFGCWRRVTQLVPREKICSVTTSRICSVDGDCPSNETCMNQGSKIETKYVAGCSDISTSTWDVLADGGRCPGDVRPPEQVCSGKTSQTCNTDSDCTGFGTCTLNDNYCYVPPKFENLMVGGAKSGSIEAKVNVPVEVKFQFNVDSEQGPAKAYQINWEGGACTLTRETGGTPVAATLITGTHRYNTAGTYTPRFCLIDNWGATAEASPVNITVK